MGVNRKNRLINKNFWLICNKIFLSVYLLGVSVHAKALPTQMDGKCVNAIYNNTSTTRCVICGHLQSMFLDLKADFSCTNEQALNHGLRTLHLSINLMTQLLNIAEKMKCKQARAPTDDADRVQLRNVSNQSRIKQKHLSADYLGFALVVENLQSIFCDSQSIHEHTSIFLYIIFFYPII